MRGLTALSYSHIPVTVLISALVVLVLSATASFGAPDQPSHLSSDPQVVHARALIERGQFGEALLALRPLASNHPDQTDVLFLTGLAALGAAQLPETNEPERTGLLNEAIAAFRAILINRPGLVRVRLELARAFFLKGDDDLSRKHFERVLAGGPPSAMVANIQRFFEVMRARRRWSGYFGATLAPDSNINAASDVGTIYIYGLPFRRDADAGAQSGLGVVLWGGAEYQHPLTRQARLRAGVDIARREYAGRDFDQTSLSVHTGPRWLISRETETSLLGNILRRWTAGKPQSRERGGRLDIVHRLSGRMVGNGRVAWHQRDYDRDKHLDGSRTDLSLSLRWQATPTMQTDATVGYARERTQSTVWRNSSKWLRLGASFALPRGFTMGGSGEWLWTDYKGNWTPFTPDDSARADRTRILRTSVFNRAFTVFGFSPKLALVNEVRESTAQAYDYRRNRAELQFVRQF